jgi:hypothetical protein
MAGRSLLHRQAARCGHSRATLTFSVQIKGVIKMTDASIPAPVADQGRIRTGAGIRLPAPRPPVAVADAGRIRTGAGIRIRPATR